MIIGGDGLAKICEGESENASESERRREREREGRVRVRESKVLEERGVLKAGGGDLGSLKGCRGLGAKERTRLLYLGNLIVGLCTWEMEGIRVVPRLYSHGPHNGAA